MFWIFNLLVFQINLIKRFILDAKFKEDLASEYSGGISALIQELYIVKNYAEDNRNSVFILHPSKNSIKNRLSPLKWGKNSYYGESPMFDWESTLKHEGTFRRDHQFGSVMLSPVRDDGKPLDDLQRLIGMFLQYGMRETRKAIQLDNGEFAPQYNENIICIVCGSNKHYFEPSSTKKGSKYSFTCCECKHFSVYIYCYSCKNKLMKNGSYWTYHGTQPLNPTNVVCPVCDELL